MYDNLWVVNDATSCFFAGAKVIVYKSCDELYQCTLPRPSKISEKNVSIFDIPFMIGSYAESMKKILGAL